MNTRRSAGCAVISLILIFSGCATTQQVDMEQFSSDMSPAISADSPDEPEAGIPRVSSQNHESGLEHVDHPHMLPIIRSHEAVSPGVEGSIRSAAVREPVFSDASISLPLPELKQSRAEDAEDPDGFTRESSQVRPDANADANHDANPAANPAVHDDEPGEATRASEQGELPLPNVELNTESIAELPSPSEPEESTQEPVNRPDSAVTVEESPRDNAAAPGIRKNSVGVSPSRTSSSQPADSKESGASAPADGGKTETNVKVEVYLDDGNLARVPLEGRGWVFIRSSGDADFVSKNREQDREVFIFSVSSSGDQDLLFQRQNLTDGRIDRKSMDISFLSPLESDGSANQTSNPPVSELGEDASDSRMADHADTGENTAAQNPMVDASLPGTAAVAHTGEVDQQNEYHGMAPEELERLALEFLANNEKRKALELLELISRKYPAYDNIDRVLFRQAQLLEGPGPARNINRSLASYRELIDLFPFSSFERDARERIRYIERSFIRVF